MKLSTVRSSGVVRVVRVQAYGSIPRRGRSRPVLVHVVHVVRSSVSTSWWDCMPSKSTYVYVWGEHSLFR